MITAEKSVMIDMPVEEVFAYLSDPARMPKYWVGVDEVKHIQRLPDGRSTFTVGSKFIGLHVEMEGEQVEVIPNERFVWKTHSAAMNVTTTVRFERLESRKTRVSAVSEHTLHSGGPLETLGEPFFQKYVDHGTQMSMEAAKTRILAEAPAATPG